MLNSQGGLGFGVWGVGCGVRDLGLGFDAHTPSEFETATNRFGRPLSPLRIRCVHPTPKIYTSKLLSKCVSSFFLHTLEPNVYMPHYGPHSPHTLDNKP